MSLPPITDMTVTELLAFNIPPAEEVYDAIMSEIEPELTTANIKKLKKKYAKEDPEKRKQRFKGYEESFKKYEETFGLWMSSLKLQYERARKELMHSAEEKTHKRELEKLDELESMFDSTTDTSL